MFLKAKSIILKAFPTYGSKFSSIQFASDASTITKIRSIYLSISSSEVVEIK